MSDGQDLAEAVIVQPGDSELQISTITDKISLETIGLNLSWGAENASIQHKEIMFNRSKIAQSVISQPTIREQYAANFGAWRPDIVEKFLGKNFG